MRCQHRGSDGTKGAEALGKGATRLLSALEETGSTSRPDPAREGFVIVRGATRGISLGRGGFPRADLDELVSRDLVTPAETASAFRISATGRARLLREKAARSGAGAERFGAQHRELERSQVHVAGQLDEVSANLRESPLAWLRRRRGPDGEPLIEAASFEAGERLRRDLTFAGLLPSVTARWDGAIGGGSGQSRDPASATDSVIAARQRARAALAAVGGDFAGLLLDLCGFLKGIEAIERERRWPPRSGKVVAGLALRRLADHYGLANEASGRDRSAGIRTWSEDRDSP